MEDFAKRYGKRNRDRSTDSEEKKAPTGGNGVSWLDEAKEVGSGKSLKKSSKESERRSKDPAELPV